VHGLFRGKETQVLRLRVRPPQKQRRKKQADAPLRMTNPRGMAINARYKCIPEGVLHPSRRRGASEERTSKLDPDQRPSLRLAFDRQFSRRRYGVAGLGDIHQGEAKLLPLMKSTQQRTHVTDAVFAEFQRHPGAGRFVWSSTEEDDFAVAGDLAIARLQVLR
jgi:hypothetical protein